MLQPLLEAFYVELTRIRAVVELTAGLDSAELVPAYMQAGKKEGLKWHCKRNWYGHASPPLCCC